MFFSSSFPFPFFSLQIFQKKKEKKMPKKFKKRQKKENPGARQAKIFLEECEVFVCYKKEKKK